MPSIFSNLDGFTNTVLVLYGLLILFCYYYYDTAMICIWSILNMIPAVVTTLFVLFVLGIFCFGTCIRTRPPPSCE